MQLAAVEVYRNLGLWLLQKTESDIEKQFRDIAARRVADGIGLHQFVWALIVSRDHLWQFLQRETFADNIVELFGKLELQEMLNQFFDRAVYYAILGYAAARNSGSCCEGFGAGSAACFEDIESGREDIVITRSRKYPTRWFDGLFRGRWVRSQNFREDAPE